MNLAVILVGYTAMCLMLALGIATWFWEQGEDREEAP